MKLKSTQKLAKFLAYILGRRPDEFGLVPQKNGYINTKELLKALIEEKEWRHIRMAHLKEVAITVIPPTIELQNQFIRAVDRDQLPQITATDQLPKLLYIALRQRAYPVIIEKGLRASSQYQLVLAADEKMAQRIGRRRDHHPVLLTVQVARSIERGTRYQRYGDILYLADVIYPDTFSGPSLPKERPIQDKPQKSIDPLQAKTPGSYFADIDPHQTPQRPRRKEVEWKKDRRRARKHKSRQQG